jgi:hypothetical protein
MASSTRALPGFSPAGQAWFNNKGDDMEATRHYFVGHRCVNGFDQQLRGTIERVFTPKGYLPAYADRLSGPQPILQALCQQIYSTPFGIFDLSNEDANVYIELGIAMAFNKRFIVIAHLGAENCVPSSLKAHTILYYADENDLTQKLSASLEPFFRELRGPVDYCYYCDKTCEGLTAYPDRNTYLILDKPSILTYGDWKDLKAVLEPCFDQSNLHAISIRNADGAPWLCSIRKKVRSTQFSVCHLGKLATPDAYIALGMAIGYCKPWLLISKEDPQHGENGIPSDLRGQERLQYTSIPELNEKLGQSIGEFLELFYGKAHLAETSVITREPFWMKLYDWLETVHPPLKVTAQLRGSMRIVQVGNQGFLDKFLITRKGLLLGRDETCDIKIQHALISSRHARVFEQDGACYIQDLNRRTGTYLNGRRLFPNEVERVKRGDSLRLAHAERYLVWDDSPLPADPLTASIHKKGTGVLSSEIILQGEKLPTSGEGIDYTFYLEIQGEANGTYQVQSYYRLGKILDELARIRKVQANQVCFVFRKRILDESSTLLGLELREELPLYLVQYRDVVQQILLQKYTRVENRNIQESVDFIFRRTASADPVVLICASKSEIKTQDISSLRYAANALRKIAILSARGQVLNEVADIEREMQVIQEKKRLRLDVMGADLKLHNLDTARSEKRKAVDLFDELARLYEAPPPQGPGERQKLTVDIETLLRRIRKCGITPPDLRVSKLIELAALPKQIDASLRKDLDDASVTVMGMNEIAELIDEGQPVCAPVLL